ncbi:MAG TPA: hypothetical protein VKA30_03650, partial [Actinomycetota bacterium]|nr:hypothetical protein [Actinomycetota bacterium]
QAANSQRYFPRHGFNDTNSAKELDELGLMPEKEAHRSLSVGWTDLDASYETGWHPNPQRVRCVKLMKDHGIDTTDPNALAAALDACDNLWFIQLVMNRMTGTISVDGFVNVVNTLRYEYLSTLSFATYFSASRHDGVAGVRIMNFVDSCSCYKFLTTPYKV